jgi:hypothetical protein
MMKKDEIYEVNLYELEKFWTEANYAKKLNEWLKNISLAYFYTKLQTLATISENNYTRAVSIFDNKAFFLQENGELCQQKLEDSFSIRLKETNLTSLNFILFLSAPKLYELYKNSEEIVKFSSPFSPPPFIISLPSRPKNEDLNFWVYCLYLVDIVFIITFFYVLRKLYNRLQVALGKGEIDSIGSLELVSFSPNRQDSSENNEDESPYILRNYGYVPKNNK